MTATGATTELIYVSPKSGGAVSRTAGDPWRDRLLKLPGFLGLSAIVSTTDLLATLPRHIGETLARAAGLQVLPCPVPVPSFVVKQHWHARFHHDAANRWLRGVCAELFMDAARAKAADN